MSAYDRVLEAVEALTSQIETGSDEVVLRRDDAIAIVKAFEIQTSYIARLEELLEIDDLLLNF